MYIKKGRRTVPRATVSCAGCGVSIARRASDLARLKTGRAFCSKPCRDRVGCKPRRGDYKACGLCGKVFYHRRCYGNQRFCSRKCQALGHTKPKVHRVCETCGKQYDLKPSQALAGAGRFCSKDCKAIGQTTRHAGFDHNGRPAIIDKGGYVRVWEPNHPRSKRWYGRVLYHRLIMEQALGRCLSSDEQVDHINRIKTDNRLENLQLMSAVDHSHKTRMDQARDRVELEQYRARYGPLNS